MVGTDKTELLRLADAISSDLEGSTTLDLILAKAYGLAEATNNDEAVTWIGYELYGYDTSTEIGRKYAHLTQRWDGKSETGYLLPATGIVQSIKAMTHTLEAYKDFVPSGNYAGDGQRN